MTTQNKPLAPENAESPFLVAGGFGYDEKRNGVASEYIKSLGYTAVTPVPDPDTAHVPSGFIVRTEDGTEKVVPRQLTYLLAPKPEVTLVSSQYQKQRSENLIAHIEEQGTGPINGIFQSADAQNGLLAARKRPDLFNNIVLAFPSGLVKKHSSTEYTRQMLKGSVRHRGDKHLPAISDDFESAVRLRSLRDRRAERRFSKSGGFAVAASVALAYQNTLLTEVKQQQDAPGIALVLGLRDSMMRPERIIESLHYADDVDCIFITNTKHGWNGSKKLMNKTLGLFPQMEAIKEKRRAGQAVGALAERVSFAEDVTEADRQRILALVGKLDEESSRQLHAQQTPDLKNLV